MTQTVTTDIAIIGGGIAGLWLLKRLRQQGYSAVLLESGTLGGEQTHKSQGILHGGMKYTLQGALTGSAEGVADAPALWRACLLGHGSIDLGHVPVLSPTQHLWTSGSVLSKMGGFLASKAMQTRARKLTPDDFPPLFQHPDFSGSIYAFDEQVIDVHALLRELAKSQHDAIFHVDSLGADEMHYRPNGELDSITLRAHSSPPVTLHAKRYIFAAGSGNRGLLEKSGNPRIRMQRRPLHMVMARLAHPHTLYAHCLGVGATPRITVTTHTRLDGQTIWYLGGQIAEEGTHRSPDEQTAKARNELTTLFPWLDLSNSELASFFVDRAEAKQPNGNRPDSFSLEATANYLVMWPTKLVLAPQLAEHALQILATASVKSGTADLQALNAWPMPAFARPMWEQLF